MTNSNTWMGKRTRERERDGTIGLDLRELRQSREHELLYRFAMNLIIAMYNAVVDYGTSHLTVSADNVKDNASVIKLLIILAIPRLSYVQKH